MDALAATLNYLNTLREQGAERLPIDEEARSILRSWMLALKRGGRATRPGEPAASAAAQEAAAAPQAPAATDTEAHIAELREAAARPVAQEPRDEGEIPFFRPASSGSPESAWQALEQALPAWKPLRELGSLREVPVFGAGSRRASIMFVGDCPNYGDERSRSPFSGEAGAKFDAMLRAMGLGRESIYLTHLVKFRPAQPRQTLNTRVPNEREIALSLPVLDYEIGLLQPKVIVALGIIAARGILQLGPLPLAAYQEQRAARYRGIPVVVTHHPSYLLRTADLSERRRLWEEMLRVMELAGLAISAKQRGYFLPKPNAI
ncbi:MAG: uracil-DNA glycosylase [Akkermansia sp.]